MFQEYLIQNWALILILLAFIISLLSTVLLNKKTIIRMYFLIGAIFLLSIVVFIEFNYATTLKYKTLKTVFMAIRYSATPVIIALICMTLVKKMRWFIFIPSFILIILNFVNIFTGIVTSIGSDMTYVHGPLWLIPYIAVGLYSVILIYLLLKHCNKTITELLPIIFLTLSLGSGLILPFILREAYASIFCTTIAIALFAYYEFMLLPLTKKDALTGLLNRHAYFADINKDPRTITSLISIDMNGLKALNDKEGHAAGDEALETLAVCFIRPLNNKQAAYRIGGDEFIIVCRKTFKDDVLKIVEKIKKSVNDTKYSVSIGYSFNFEGDKTISELLKESDKMMYQEKEKYYQSSDVDRRRS
jgi:diguanylate cyclase (GGDEF)-like protein